MMEDHQIEMEKKKNCILILTNLIFLPVATNIQEPVHEMCPDTLKSW